MARVSKRECQQVADRLDRIADLLRADRPGIATDVQIGANTVRALLRKWSASRHVNSQLSKEVCRVNGRTPPLLPETGGDEYPEKGN